jgi:antitoxin component of RelBE/YafQ-DinJ toxin-antitoxin module
VVQEGLPLAVKNPNATTIDAMKEARSMKRAKFGSAQEFFDDLEKARAIKARKPAKKRR